VKASNAVNLQCEEAEEEVANHGERGRLNLLAYQTMRRIILSVEETTKSSLPTLHVFLQHTMRGMIDPVRYKSAV